MGLAVEIGMAKPMPSIWVEESLEELIPTTWPYLLISAPPEVPGVDGGIHLDGFHLDGLAGILIGNGNQPLQAGNDAWVTEPARFIPVGLPIATIRSPTHQFIGVAEFRGGQVAGVDLDNATSVFSSMPTTSASYSSSLSRITRIRR